MSEIPSQVEIDLSKLRLSNNTTATQIETALGFTFSPKPRRLVMDWRNRVASVRTFGITGLDFLHGNFGRYLPTYNVLEPISKPS